MKTRSLIRRRKFTIEEILSAPKRITAENGPFGGYEKFWIEGRWYFTHQYIINRERHICPICNKKLPRKSHNIVHHKDGTRLNNDPSNLQLVARSEHYWLHSLMANPANKPTKLDRPVTGRRRRIRPAFLARRITWG
jgi:hypothetical protein